MINVTSEKPLAHFRRRERNIYKYRKHICMIMTAAVEKPQMPKIRRKWPFLIFRKTKQLQLTFAEAAETHFISVHRRWGLWWVYKGHGELDRQVNNISIMMITKESGTFICVDTDVHCGHKCSAASPMSSSVYCRTVKTLISRLDRHERYNLGTAHQTSAETRDFCMCS